jgi:hypothetical protein
LSETADELELLAFIPANDERIDENYDQDEKSFALRDLQVSIISNTNKSIESVDGNVTVGDAHKIKSVTISPDDVIHGKPFVSTTRSKV